MPALNLKDKIEGDTLDLSLMTLKDVPVPEIAAIQKIRQLDLSNNEIISLPLSFAPSLGHLAKLDLGRNKITKLPENFGQLFSLKHLDLYNNQLTELPNSFENLKALRWLDVKGNPLKKEYSTAAGSCSDYQECQTAAKRLVYLCKKQREADEKRIVMEKARKLEEEALLAQKQKADEEVKEKAVKKKQAKAQKKQEKKQNKQSTQTVPNGTSVSQNGGADHHTKETQDMKRSTRVQEKSSAFSCLAWVNMVLSILLLFSCMLCFYTYSEGDLSISGSYKALDKMKENGQFLLDRARPYWQRVSMETVAIATVAKNSTLTFGNYVMSTAKTLNLSKEFDNLLNTVRLFLSFLWDQLLVVYEEFRRNEALKGLFEFDFSNLKENFRSWVNVLVELVTYMWEIVVTKCIPVIEKQFNVIYEWVRKAIN